MNINRVTSFLTLCINKNIFVSANVDNPKTLKVKDGSLSGQLTVIVEDEDLSNDDADAISIEIGPLSVGNKESHISISLNEAEVLYLRDFLNSYLTTLRPYVSEDERMNPR